MRVGRLRGACNSAWSTDARQGQQADGRALQEGRRAADASAPGDAGGAGRRSGQARRPGARRHLHRRRAGRRHRHEPGHAGFRASCGATTSAAARRRTARCSTARPGRLAPRPIPSRVVKGMRAAGRMGSDRVTTRNLKVVRIDAENHLLVVARRRPRRAGRSRAGAEGGGAPNQSRSRRPRSEEGQEVVMTLDVVNARERKGRLGRSERCRVWRAGRRPTWCGSRSCAQNASERRGTHMTKNRALVSGQRQEALAAEGNRPRPRGRNPQPALAQGRHRVRPPAAQLRLRAAEESGARRAPGGAAGQAAERRGHRRRRSCTSPSGRRRRRPNCSRAWARRAGRSSSTWRPTRSSACRRATSPGSRSCRAAG